MRRTALKARRKPAEATPERYAFKEVVWGHCEVCKMPGFVRRHHIVREQHVRLEGGDCWDTDNALWVGVDFTCRCHERHHSACKRIPLSLVPLRAVAFAEGLYGLERARDYLSREYA